MAPAGAAIENGWGSIGDRAGSSDVAPAAAAAPASASTGARKVLAPRRP